MRWVGIVKRCDIAHTDGDQFLGDTAEPVGRNERVEFNVRGGPLCFLIRTESIRHAVVLVCLALRGDRHSGAAGCHDV